MPGFDGKEDPPKATPHGDDEPTLPAGSPSPGRSAESSAVFDTAALLPLAQRYDILNELGRGGMGAVYRARDRETGDIVALKILLPEIAARPDLIERFKSELLLARKITHKNVCRTHELLRFGSTVAISMEYVEGESLRAFLKRYGSVPLRRGLEWVGQICSALAEAHAQGVVHRDLKPENILVTRDASAKVMDFGIARSLEGAATQSVGAMGTPAYMSPEQAEGKPADARSDIYSFGLMMYEMFAGRPAFQADTSLAMLAKHVHETPPDPIKLEPYLPAFLDRVIRKCLEKNSKKRFQSVAELQVALAETSEAAAAVEAETPEAPVPLHLAHWQRREYYLLGAAIVAAAAFFYLYDGLFPWAGVEYRITAQTASEKALALISNLDPSARSPSARPYLWPPWQYHASLLLFGLPGANQSYLDSEPGWVVNVEVGEKPIGLDRPRRAYVRLSPSGELSSFNVPRATIPAKGTPPAQNQILGRAIQDMKDFYGQDVSKLAPRKSVRFGDELALEWNLPGPRPDTERLYTLRFAPEGLVMAFWGITDKRFEEARGKEHFSAAFQLERRWEKSILAAFLLFLGVSLLMVILFFVRRLYQRTQPRALSTAFFAVLALGGLALPAQEADFWELAWVFIPLFAVLAFLFAYAVASVAEHYLLRAMPSRLATWRILFHERLKGHTAGLAVLRGVLLGVLSLGLYVVVLRGLALLGWVGPSLFWLLPINEFFSFLFAPGAAIASTLAGACVVVAFPAALAARASRRAFVPVIVPAVFCLVTASTLPGASAFPLSPQLLMAALQGLFFSYVLYRYDFLTLLIAIFTAETWLLIYPVYRMFHRIEWLKSSLGMLPWFLLLLLGLTIYFRPQLSAGLKRVAAVFE